MPYLPFQVGELIESKCFQAGFRGAWFRSKIRDIGTKGADLSYLLEYPDYPDNKMTWIKLYQKPKPPRKKSKNYRELVVRPRFPTIHRESEKLDVNAISDVVVIVDDTWRVGDLVDWFTDGCYWCGTVSEVLGDGEVKIDLLPYPLGEGSSYTVPSKDLRPSLDWIPEKGWTVPMPMDDRSRRPCARIINPTKSGGSTSIIHARDGAAKVGQPTVGISLHSPRNSECLLESHTECLLESSERFKEMNTQCNSVINGMDIIKSDTNMSIENLEADTTNSGNDNEYPAKKMRTKGLCLNSMSSNTVEAALLDLEELVNRIKWLKDVLKMRVPLPGIKQSSWKFLQHHAPCK